MTKSEILCDQDNLVAFNLETVSTLLPTGYTIFFSLPYLIFCLNFNKPIGHENDKKNNNIHILKLLLSVTFLCLNTSSEILFSTKDAKFLQQSLTIVTSVITITVAQIEKSKGVSTSIFLFFLWSLKSLEIFCCLIATQNSFSDTQVVFQFILLVVSLLQVAIYGVIGDFQGLPSRQATACVVSKLTFTWMSKQISARHGKYWHLPDCERSQHLSQLFQQEWKKISGNIKEPPKALATALFHSFGARFVFAGVLKLAHDILLLLGPLQMMLLTGYMKDNALRPAWHGYGIAAGLLVNCLAQTIALQQYNYNTSLVGMRVRSALAATMFDKSLRLSNASRLKESTGQTLNLISVDASNFLDSIMSLHILWSAPFQLSLIIILLWMNLGAATFGGVVIMLSTLIFSIYIAKLSKRFQLDKTTARDERMKLINEMLTGIKAIKIYAWELSFVDRITKARDKEVAFLQKCALLKSVSSTVWNIVPNVITLATFGAYVFRDASSNLDPSTAFVSIVLFNLMRFLLVGLPNVISCIIQSTVSLKRIADYLLLDELNENNVVRRPRGSNTVLAVNDGHFSWDKPCDDVFQLNSVNLSVKRGELIAVVGQVGAGKSSLLSACLGEMVKSTGTVMLSGSCGYVAQMPWIQNASVKANVIFSSKFNQRWYRQIIEACALAPDLQLLAAGDKTEIGEKGINLSGGQKQRIALARAVYAQTDVYLLDDPLSAVDSHTASHLFKHVIGPAGLIRKRRNGFHSPAVIWVMQQLNFLPHCDRIIFMKDGEIVGQGTFAELEKRNRLFDGLVRSYMTKQVGNEPILDEASQTRALAASDGVRKRTKNMKIDENSTKVKAGKTIIETEGIKAGQVNLSIFLSYFKALGHFSCLTVFTFYTFSHVLASFTQNYLSVWTDEVAKDAEAALLNKQLRFNVITVIYACHGLAFLIASVTMATASISASRLFHARLLATIARVPMLFFESTPFGRIIDRFSKDVDVIDTTLREAVGNFLLCCLHITATILIIAYKVNFFIVAAIPLLYVFSSIQQLFVAFMGPLQRVESATRSPVLSRFSETFTGANTVRAFGRQASFRRRFTDAVDENQTAVYISQMGQRWLSIRLDTIGALVVFSTAFFGVYQRDFLNPGSFAVALAYALSLSQRLNWVVRQRSEVETNIVAVERIDDYASAEREADWSNVDSSTENWPSLGEIVFDDVILRYRKNLDPALCRLSFRVRPREKVGVVGRTGAGKSSLSTALLRIVEIERGRVSIDGIDLTSIGTHQLRRTVTSIPQDSILFSGTLRSNLDPFEERLDEEIVDALNLVGIPLDQDGIWSNVAENGENLSAGQRQLVCMARALLRRSSKATGNKRKIADVLIMDEATAAVDATTDRLITRLVRSEFAEATVLTIAHRLDTIINYDRILVLADGSVVECDTPSKLLANKSSKFYKMAKAAGLTR